ANMLCGKTQDTRILTPIINDGIPEVTVERVHQVVGKVRLIDVRTPEEFNNELGHIKGAELVTLGPELTRFLERGDRSQEIIFVCRSSGRSGHATSDSQKLGYVRTANMIGGMIKWNELRYEIERQ